MIVLAPQSAPPFLVGLDRSGTLQMVGVSNAGRPFRSSVRVRGWTPGERAEPARGRGVLRLRRRRPKDERHQRARQSPDVRAHEPGRRVQPDHARRRGRGVGLRRRGERHRVREPPRADDPLRPRRRRAADRRGLPHRHRHRVRLRRGGPPHLDGRRDRRHDLGLRRGGPPDRLRLAAGRADERLRRRGTPHRPHGRGNLAELGVRRRGPRPGPGQRAVGDDGLPLRRGGPGLAARPGQRAGEPLRVRRAEPDDLRHRPHGGGRGGPERRDVHVRRRGQPRVQARRQRAGHVRLRRGGPAHRRGLPELHERVHVRRERQPDVKRRTA